MNLRSDLLTSTIERREFGLRPSKLIEECSLRIR
jgi:hypothetical protein